MRAIRVEWPRLHPYCVVARMLLVSMNHDRRELIIFSRILLRELRSEIGRYDEG